MIYKVLMVAPCKIISIMTNTFQVLKLNQNRAQHNRHNLNDLVRGPPE